MFKALKEKLKGWIKKTEPEVEEKPKQKATLKEKKEKQPEREERPKEQKPFSLFKKRLTEERFEELFAELEIILLQNNVAFETVEKIKFGLKTELVSQDTSKVDIKEKLRESIEGILANPPDIIEEIKKTLSVKTPVVITFLGINGSGKTTTIAKFATLLKKNKISCCIAAADTFRAASIEQIQKHSEKLEIPLIKKDYGNDPASVGFEAIQYAKKHHINTVLIDTAGRMNNKDSLMKELEKIIRVTKSDINIFVAESITGNDAIEQATSFNRIANLTGIILSKSDVDEKGGTAISIGSITKKPILFLGTGQGYKDLEVFNKENLIKTLGL